MYIKNYNLKKEAGITIKSKQTSNQLKPVTRNILYVGYIVISQSQMHAQIKYSVAHLQDLIPILASAFCILYFIPAKVGIKSCRFARECFICACIWLWDITV